ncbi:MAG: magnesium transporter [Actinomycetota bacterium]
MAFPRRARRLWDYWRAEKRTLGQGFVALIVSTAASFVAGITLGSITHTLEALPGLVILIPAAVGMRGTIFGSMGARLGTSAHAGLLDVTRDRSGVLKQNISVAVALTFGSSLYLAALAKLAAAAFGLASISFWDFVTISVVGGVLSSAFILFATIGLAVVSTRREYDLDSVATPLVSAVGDMVTLPMLFLATFLLRFSILNSIVAAACVVAGLFAIRAGLRTQVAQVRRILIEMTAVVILTPMLDIAAGLVLQARLDKIAVIPGLLIIVPPFVSQAGALGGILSSRLTSKLQLGVVSPRGLPGAPALIDASLVLGLGATAFTLIGATGLGLSYLLNQAHPAAASMIGGTFVAGMLATAVAIVVGYYLAILTTRFGLDPDNHGVPIVTSLMDLTGILCILLVLPIYGVANG